MSSIFTKIVNGEVPAYKIAETEDFLAFLDINPIQKGHVLVISKNEVDKIFDLNDKNFIGLHVFSKFVARGLEKAIDCERVAVVVLGLEVPHAHIHLIPVKTEKDIDFSQKRKELAEDEFVEIQQRILAYL